MDVILTVAIITGGSLATFCLYCGVKPDSVAANFRRRYQRSSKLVQKLPFASMVMKPWYPTYVRIVGLLGFVCGLVWLYKVIALIRK